MTEFLKSRWKAEGGRWKALTQVHAFGTNSSRESHNPSALSASSVVKNPNPHTLRLPPSAFCLCRRLHSGISLIEVLISMFVLLFGLMGVAAIFPVGNYYVLEGEKHDLGAGLAQNAFEEMRARGMLKPEFWHYADPFGNLTSMTVTTVNDPGTREFISSVMQPKTLAANGGAPNTAQGTSNITGANGPGHAFVLDPLGNAADTSLAHLDVFPRFTDSDGVVYIDNPWEPNPMIVPGSNFLLSGERWPVRRITVRDAGGQMRQSVAETIFRLRDDLAVEQPDESDRPSIQRWDTLDTAGTPSDPSDDTLLRRQYKGNYSWLATIVPTTERGLTALQPASPDYGQIDCDVSVVVFRKREETPSASSERLINAELLSGGELVIYSPLDYDATPAKQDVDAAIDKVRPGNWISVMGVNQTTGDFVLKWYRILSMDDETTVFDIQSDRTPHQARRLMLLGPDWPAVPHPTTGLNPPLSYIPDLRAGILPGVVTVVTKPLKMENSSLWDLQ